MTTEVSHPVHVETAACGVKILYMRSGWQMVGRQELWPVECGEWYVEVVEGIGEGRDPAVFARCSKGIGEPPEGLAQFAFAPTWITPKELAIWFCAMRNITESLECKDQEV